jgi:hypothetical protein
MLEDCHVVVKSIHGALYNIRKHYRTPNIYEKAKRGGEGGDGNWLA